MKIHFIGIGGIGVSALAKYYLSRGFEVSGSDVCASPITEDLKKRGAEIFIGHRRENFDGANKTKKANINLMVYSAAVEKNNPELKEARRRKIKCQTYAQALGELTKKYFTIAVSGTHGKSTTTAMIALIMVEAGLDPTVIVGTKLREFGNSNFKAGESKYLVIEADEYAASFLNYWPKIAVVNNIEEDHLDYYKNLKNILKAFRKFVGHMREDGVLVANEEDENINKIVQSAKCKIQNYSSKFKIESLNLKVPGRHNLMDAYAALSVARALKIPDEVSLRALNKFTGTWRRFEYKGEINGAKIFDDYGHHPTEIRATLKGARELLNKSSKLKIQSSKLLVIYQPHQYQRTFALFDQFVGAFDEADKLVLLPIYSVVGREKENIKKLVNSKKLAGDIKKRYKKLRFYDKSVVYLKTQEEASNYLKKNLKKGDIILIMGAGDVYLLTKILTAKN